MASRSDINDSLVLENITARLLENNWTSDAQFTDRRTMYSSNSEEGLISHHRDLVNWPLTSPNYQDTREFLDRPLMGIAIIGGFFLSISLLLVVAVVVFYLKRNTVFVLEKSVHGGFYRSTDQSTVIGQTSAARNLGKQALRTSRMHKREDCTDDTYEDEELYSDEDFTDDSLQEVNFDELSTPNRSRASAFGSYALYPDHLLFANPENISHLGGCNHRFTSDKMLVSQAHCAGIPQLAITQTQVGIYSKM
ncbi:hypothetical protein FBUS_04968 [Fasciolopsis buskii]|uniref:Uncharacterized protein n=1 Tax=Fasciolopsis buskii TaxID=27845 RepID=A0A8E0VN56_9TREM|nr:hypothetical protein FBUS_04968 [Fasciolopsis buski]